MGTIDYLSVARRRKRKQPEVAGSYVNRSIETAPASRMDNADNEIDQLVKMDVRASGSIGLGSCRGIPELILVLSCRESHDFTSVRRRSADSTLNREKWTVAEPSLSLSIPLSILST